MPLRLRAAPSCLRRRGCCCFAGSGGPWSRSSRHPVWCNVEQSRRASHAACTAAPRTGDLRRRRWRTAPMRLVPARAAWPSCSTADYLVCGVRSEPLRAVRHRHLIRQPKLLANLLVAHQQHPPVPIWDFYLVPAELVNLAIFEQREPHMGIRQNQSLCGQQLAAAASRAGAALPPGLPPPRGRLAAPRARGAGWPRHGCWRCSPGAYVYTCLLI